MVIEFRIICVLSQMIMMRALFIMSLLVSLKTSSSSGNIQGHVILDNKERDPTEMVYENRRRIETDHETCDKLEFATILRKGQFCGDAFSDILYEIYQRENIVVVFTKKYSVARTSVDPSTALLEHCKRIIERKFSEPKFGGMNAIDLNESADYLDLVFATHNLAIPVFLSTDDVEQPSNEVHLLLVDVVTNSNRDKMEEREFLSTIIEFFREQGHEADNTWVGIDEYATIDDKYLLPQDAVQPEEADDEFTVMKSSTVFLNDHSSWSSLQKFMFDVSHGFTYSIAYRMFEMIGTKDPDTGTITFKHPEKLSLGIPVPKTKT